METHDLKSCVDRVVGTYGTYDLNLVVGTHVDGVVGTYGTHDLNLVVGMILNLMAGR